MSPKDIERLLNEAEPRFARAWLAVLSKLRDQRSIVELGELLLSGRIEEAMAGFTAGATRLGATWNETFIGSGSRTSRFIEKAIGEVAVDFNVSNARAVRVMQENGLRLVQQFTQQQRAATMQAISDGIAEGANPRTMARRFRDSIGLTRKQQQIISNYRRQLLEGDRGALRRQLRDRRFDRTIRRAFDNRQPLTEAQIDRMVEAYRKRFVAHRAETIARTESLSSVNAGNREMFQQALEMGHVSDDQIVRRWNTAGDERVRDFGRGADTSHLTMEGQEVRGMETHFVSGAGNLALHPGGFGIGSEDVQCRCVVSTTIDVARSPGLLSVEFIDR